MPVPVYIAGTGLVTAAGRSIESTFDAICGGVLVRDSAVVDVSMAPVSTPWSDRFNGNHRLEFRATSKVAALAFEAANQALASSAWTVNNLTDPQTALIVCTSKGPILNDVARASGPSPAETANTGWEPVPQGFGLATVATDLAKLTGINAGPRLVASAACASGLHGLARAVMMLRSGQIRRALVLAAEASVHPLFLGSFKRLGVLCPTGQICRPFDEHRNGFHIADAAAAVCLEIGPADQSAVEIDRIAIAGDATHLTGSNSDGQVLRHILRSVNDNKAVDFVHAHGTGTALNDAIELAAIDSILTRDTPVFSHKGALGHTLGASSLVSVVLTAESHRRGVIPPNTATDRPIASRFARIEPRSRLVPVRRSLVTAAGFGGAIAALTLKS